MNPTRFGVAAALSAALLVGAPILTAAPATAFAPADKKDDPAPLDEGPPVLLEPGLLPDEDGPAVQVQQVLDNDDPPSEEDRQEPAEFLAQQVDPVNEVTEQAGVADLTADDVPAAEEENQPEIEAPDAPEAGDDTGDDIGDETSNEANDGEAEADSDEVTTDATARADGAVSGDASDTTDAVTAAGAEAAAVAGGATTRTEPLAVTGAPSMSLLQIGLGLISGGVLLAGSGRHRRNGRAARTI